MGRDSKGGQPAENVEILTCPHCGREIFCSNMEPKKIIKDSTIPKDSALIIFCKIIVWLGIFIIMGLVLTGIYYLRSVGFLNF